MNKLNLIPYPQKINLRSGCFQLEGKYLNVFFGSLPEADVCRLSDFMKRTWGLERVNTINDAHLVLEIDAKLNFPLNSNLLNQSYFLDVAPLKIHIRARHPQGLFYALQTLFQLRDGNQFPACRIEDWPELSLRALHITGAGNLPKFDLILQLIDQLAAWKYNSLIFEYDDRFSFERYPVLNHPAALTKEQIKTMQAFAANRYFEIIPSLDSLGHAQAYLQHPEFQHLAELPGNIHEMCPSNPETLKFIKELWSEIIEAHPGASYAGITGDEVFRLGGFCPKCDIYAKENRLSELYTNYYADLGNWVLAQGLRPIMWSDMIEIHPEDLKRLPAETIFADWNYSGHPEGAEGQGLYLRGAGEYRQGDEASIPERYKKAYGKYIVSTDGATPFEPFPYLRFFKENGFDVLASPMANTMRHVGFVGRIANSRHLAQAGIKAGAVGLLNTTWEAYLPTYNSLHGIASGAAYAWCSAEDNEEKFMRRFAQAVLGRESSLPDAAEVTDRLFVKARGYETAPRETDVAVLRDTIADLRAKLADAPTPSGKIYAELSALRLELALRPAALQEAQILSGQLRLGEGDDQPVSLANHLNWDGVVAARSGIFELTPGLQAIHGIPFEIADPGKHAGKRAILIGGERSLVGKSHGKPVVIKVERHCETLFFLVGAAWGAMGEATGLLRVTYEDSVISDLPIVVGENAWNWSSGQRPDGRGVLQNSLPAWEGAKAIDGGDGYRISLYMCWLQNSQPEKIIQTVTFLPADSGAGFSMLFGMTARAPGTTRPAANFVVLKKRAESLLREMKTLEEENSALIERHREIYTRLEEPADAALRMEKLQLANLEDGISALSQPDTLKI